MFKKLFGVLAAISVAGLALTGCGAKDVNGGNPALVTSPAPASTDNRPLTIGLTYIPNVQFSPFYVARDENLFQWDNGDGTSTQTVELRHHGADEGLFNALMSGKEDMVVAFGDEATQAVSQGMPLSVIGVLYQRYPVVVITRKDSGIKTWTDLKGKTVGLPGRYGSNWFGFQAGLDAAGMTLDDVNIAEIGYTQQTQLTTGKVDAVVGFTNNDLVRFQLAGIDVNTLALPEDIPLVGAVIVTTQDYAKKNPQICQAAVDAMAKAVQEITINPEKAITATKNYDQTLNNDQALAAAKKVVLATNELTRIDNFSPEKPGAASLPDPAKFRSMISLLDKIGALKSQTELNSVDGKELAKLVWKGEN